jgi:2-amino-4-hydroxy-6-hydroxymethyldihydropteridine diphosphokinase
MTRVFIGVGSNIAPEANIRAAIKLLAFLTRLVGVSSFYRTPAEGRPEQPDYINGVVEIETDLAPEALKNEVLRKIEFRLGRRRTENRFAPRPIDLDMLLYGSRQIRTADLRLPSEDIENRWYVAVPLAEIAPDLIIPGTATRARELAARFAHVRMVPLALGDDVRRECLPLEQHRRTPAR